MGELSIKEKAKAYDEAIERAKAMIKVAANQDEAIGFTNTIFPELKESEDERIRKALITFFKRFPYDSIEQAGTNAKEAIAWLEKQGEYEYTLKSSNTEDVYKLMEYITKLAKAYELNFPNRSYDIYAFAKDILAWLEKQGEKPTLPKWKYKKDHTPLLRDSIILNKYGGVAKSPSGAIVSDVWVIDYDELAKLPKEELEKQGEQKVPVSDFKAKDWYVSKVDGKIRNIYHSVDKVEPKFKVGDWVVNNQTSTIYLVKSIRDDEYCLWPLDAKIEGFLRIVDVDSEYHLWTIQDAKDGDVLANDFNEIFIFKNIKEDTVISYCSIIDRTSDIVINSFDEKEVGCTSVVNFYPSTKEQRDLLFQKMKEAGYEWDSEKKELKIIDWSKHINYEPNSPSIIEENTEWSEEDERMFNNTIGAVCTTDYYTYDDKQEIENWLKSLKQRIGG